MRLFKTIMGKNFAKKNMRENFKDPGNNIFNHIYYPNRDKLSLVLSLLYH